MKRKHYANDAAALAAYHVINADRGLPARGANGYGNPVGPNTCPDTGAGEPPAGWTVARFAIVDGPGPTVAIVLPEAAAADLHARGIVDMSGRVDHNDPEAWIPRAPVKP